MPTDEDNQDGHFFLNHPKRGEGAMPLRIALAVGTRGALSRSAKQVVSGC